MLLSRTQSQGSTFRKDVLHLQEIPQHHRLTGHEFERTPGDSEDREACHAAVHGVAKSWTQLSD